MSGEGHDAVVCHRCGRRLHPGRGNCYVVRIEAFADPTPPSIPMDRLPSDPGEEIDRLIHLMRDMTEQELMDQVHRRLTIQLCGSCYQEWIEDPASRGGD